MKEKQLQEGQSNETGKKSITIKDVARLSGLSKGTVDRVLHNRGEVSPKSYDKVMKVIREIGYEPNLYASLLASSKEHLVAMLIPQFNPDDYWALVNIGAIRATESVRPFNVKVQAFYYDQYSLESFNEACRKVVESNPSGVVLAPMFINETASFAGQLKTLGIPYIFIDSKIEDDGYLAYFGMPMYRSGYLCADLLVSGAEPQTVAMVRIVRDKKRKSDPTVNRRAGFMDYILQQHPDCNICNTFIDPRKPDSIEASLRKLFDDHPDLRHIAVFNSRVHLIVPFLEKYDMQECKVVGFDDLAANVAALKRGYVSYLITQHAGDQAFHAIQTLSDYLVLKKKPEKKDNYLHMDILTRYNVD